MSFSLRNKEKKSRAEKTAEVKKTYNSHKKKISRLFSLSLIVNLILRFTDFLYNFLIKSIAGRIFTAYSSEQRAFEQGAVKNYVGEGIVPLERSRKIKQFFERVLETSFFLNKLKAFGLYLLRLPLKTYGKFLLSFGVYSAIIYATQMFIFETAVENASLITAVACMILALPLLSSNKSLGRSILSGYFVNILFVDVLGFKSESLEIDSPTSRRGHSVSILLGMIAGLLTIVVSPIYLPIGILGFLFLAMVFVSPEVGIVISIFMIPFCSLFGHPSLALTSLVGISAFSYIVKLLRGKRIFKVKIIDLSILAFMVMILMGGIITVGGAESFRSALLSCVLIFGFFCVANLMRTEKWLDRCVNALVFSSVSVAVIGVLEYSLGLATKGWVDLSKFSYIEGRAVSLFDNPNVLAMYLVLTFPLVLAKSSRATLRKEKLLGFFAALSVLLCVIFTWSRGAWLALIVSALFFLAARTRKTVSVIIAFLITLPVVNFFVPLGIKTRFMSILDLTDSSIYYRLYTWKGTLDAIKDNFLGGIGYGNEAFSEIYPRYAYSGMEAAEHSHSLFLQILLALGIFGLLIFVVFLFLFAQKNFEFMKNSDDRKTTAMSSAAFSGIIGALVMGVFDNVFYNYRILFLFWVVAGISCAYIRFGKRDQNRGYVTHDTTPTSADLDI